MTLKQNYNKMYAEADELAREIAFCRQHGFNHEADYKNERLEGMNRVLIALMDIRDLAE